MTRRHHFVHSKVDALALAKQALFRKMEVDILIGLRIMEHLGRDQPTTRSTSHPIDDEVVQMLNWISLYIVPDHPNSYCDVAVAISARPGNITLHISNGSGFPTKHEHESMSLFMGALRHAFLHNLGPSLIIRDFLGMLVHRTFPQIVRKIVAVQMVDKGGPVRTCERFHSMMVAWFGHRHKGEVSRGFMDSTTFGLTDEVDQENMILLQSFFSLFRDIADPHKMDFQGKYQYLVSAITLCDLLTSSAFFDDLLNDEKFQQSLEIPDLLFLHELLRRLSQIAHYKRGLDEFVYRGVPYLKSVLGYEGMAKFLRGAGGIILNWIDSPVPPIGQTRYWPIDPSDKVRQIMAAESLDLDHLDLEMREHICQSEAVTGAWTKGDAVNPRVHCEIQMILYLEERSIDVKGNAIGTSAPMCWACHFYIKKYGTRKWKLSQTSGRARDDWCLPPSRPDLGAAMLRSLSEKVEQVVEEYACDIFP